MSKIQDLKKLADSIKEIKNVVEDLDVPGIEGMAKMPSSPPKVKWPGDPERSLSRGKINDLKKLGKDVEEIKDKVSKLGKYPDNEPMSEEDKQKWGKHNLNEDESPMERLERERKEHEDYVQHAHESFREGQSSKGKKPEKSDSELREKD